MNTNEVEIREDLGTFGGAVKNGWLKNDFVVEQVTIDKDNKGVCLKCHTGRWFGKDDEIKLYPDGTGVNLDQTASDQNFQWKTVRARTTSFAKAILIGMGAGAAVGGLGVAGWNAGRAMMTGGANIASGLNWGSKIASTGKLFPNKANYYRFLRALKKSGDYSAANKAALAKQFGATFTKTPSQLSFVNANFVDAALSNINGSALKAAGYGTGALAAGATGYALAKNATGVNQGNQQTGIQENVNEVAPLAGAAIGAAVGGLGGGLYALYKNRDNVIYYADGTYKSRKGTVSGRWDGSAENNVTPPVKHNVPQIPGMPADFAKNPENVKIAQRYLVASHANISTTKSADGIDGKLGPRTRKAIIAYMTRHNCDFAKFWQDAQDYNKTKQNVDNLKAQNLQAQMKQIQNLKLKAPEMTYQKSQQVQTVNEVKDKFYDIFNRMNNATIAQL